MPPRLSAVRRAVPPGKPASAGPSDPVDDGRASPRRGRRGRGNPADVGPPTAAETLPQMTGSVVDVTQNVGHQTGVGGESLDPEVAESPLQLAVLGQLGLTPQTTADMVAGVGIELARAIGHAGE